jgi:hypothetical protein
MSVAISNSISISKKEQEVANFSLYFYVYLFVRQSRRQYNKYNVWRRINPTREETEKV